MRISELAEAERTELADFLATLTPSEWEEPSLCAGWRVKDVVAHIVCYDELDVAGLAKRFAAGRLLPSRINQIGVVQYSSRPAEELVALVREHAAPRGLTTGFGGRIGLTDTLVHHQDIRRPLGASRDIPAERLRPALSFAVAAPPIRGAWHARGVRVVATDLEWSFGRGPEVRGPAEAILMVMAGRRRVAGELSGPGAPTLVKRLG